MAAYTVNQAKRAYYTQDLPKVYASAPCDLGSGRGRTSRTRSLARGRESINARHFWTGLD